MVDCQSDDLVNYQVWQALANAVENGYETELRAMTPQEVTDDIMDRDAEVASLPHHQVLLAVEEWLFPV
jgi:hypothetical protein